MDHLNRPHGGTLVDLLVAQDRSNELKEASRDWLSWDLTPRQLCDIELLMNGGFSPLRTFLGQKDFESVCTDMRLADGTLWPLPITLDVTDELAEKLEPGTPLVLRDPEGLMVAVIHVEEQWKLDRERKADAVYGTQDRKHPGVAHLFERTNNVAISGRLEGVELPPHYDFVRLRLTPEQTRRRFAKLGWQRVVAFQTRNPLHRAHFELTLRAARENQASLLIHPVVGMTKPGDVDHYTRVRCYQALMERYPANTAMLSLLPLAMRMGGPREALLHAILRKNYGCSHFIVGRDHAGPGKDSAGNDFYGPYDAQELMREHEEELGIKMVPFRMVVYVEDKDTYMPIDEVPEGNRTLSLSGTELRERLSEGRELPEWFTFPEVGQQLRRTHKPRHQQGFHGLLYWSLRARARRRSPTFSWSSCSRWAVAPSLCSTATSCARTSPPSWDSRKEHRDLNILRIGFVASEITKNGGIALCAPIAPYESVRSQVRELIKPGGGFILVHVSTPIEICEQRDRKGLYAKARAGIIKQFTGISDPLRGARGCRDSARHLRAQPGGGGAEDHPLPRARGIHWYPGGSDRLMDRVDDLRRIESALREAEEALKPYTPGAISVAFKSGDDPVTEADHRVDAVLRRILPSDGEGWLSEETVDDKKRVDCHRAWVVDPLDGTREFVQGIPEWSVSIGLVEDGQPVAGGILNPMTGELVLGAVGHGVTLNGEPAAMSDRTDLDGAVVLASNSEIKRGEWDRFQSQGIVVKPCGSVAYKLSLVAAGLVDATWTLVPKNEWDVVAGVALVRAAGGVVEPLEDPDRAFNQPTTLLQGLIACPAQLHRPIHELIDRIA